MTIEFVGAQGLAGIQEGLDALDASPRVGGEYNGADFDQLDFLE